MELYAKNMFFRGDDEEQKLYDCCIHGMVIFKIGDKLLSDETEWCISASAYRFLQTLFENHFMGAEDFLIPCCGHTMIPSEEKKSVTIIGCCNGIDFNIIHEEDIMIITADNTEYFVPFEDYKNAVISFAKQVFDFYKSNPPRKFDNDFEKDGYSAFVNEWHYLYEKAIELTDDVPEIKPITFEDYDAFTENEIMGMSNGGISLNPFRFINFEECAYNFYKVNGGSGKCVGERKNDDLSYTFYTSPKPIIIKFIEKKKFIEFITKENTVARIHKFEKQIFEYGYSIEEI